MKPEYISKEDISSQKMEELKELFKKEAESEGKPAQIVEKIIDGKLSKFYEEKCLLQQKWFKDESKTIQNLLDEAISKFGEAITIRRFLVWKFGG